MPRRPAPRPPVNDQVRALYRKHPAAAGWTAAEVARDIGADVSSVKLCPAFREREAERAGVDLAAADALALTALSALTSGGGLATARAVAKEANRSYNLIRRRLPYLVGKGYAESARGDPASSGYKVTPDGMKALRHLQPRRRKRAKRTGGRGSGS